MKKLILLFIAPILAFAAPTQPITNGVVPNGGTLVVQSGGAASATGSGTITATAVPVGGVSGLGTGVGTALAVAVGSAGSPVVNGGALGTPSSGTATNLTGTASGLTAGTASAVAVGGITGLGTGVGTALAVNVGSAGAPVVLNGALGTPTSGTVTNLTGTASININGTVGAGTPAAGTFTTGVFGSTTSLLLGTAGSAVGNVGFRNATSGTATLAPPAGALGTYSVTLPNAASTLPIFGQQLTFSGPTAARTVTLLDAAYTTARQDAAQTFTGVQSFTSPDVTTAITTPSTTLAVFNTTATTVNAFGAATTVNTGAAATQIWNFGGSTTASELRFLEPSGSGTNYSAFKAVAQAGNITYSLPPTAVAGGVWTDVAGNGVLTSVVPSGSVANPSATIGLTAVNGSATSAIRSDGAPALSQAIAPTWTGVHTFTPAARSSGAVSYFTLTTPADTAQTASTESIGANFTAATRQWSTGALTTQRERVFAAPTYGFVGASTLTTAVNADFTAPIAGTNATLTNRWATRADRAQVTSLFDSSSATSQIGPLVDSVDGTTPLNNIIQVVATGTAYTMTASYASLDFGTTDPILPITQAGTYSIYVNIQFNLVGATYATYDSVTAKLRRTNNTAADLTGSTFGTFIPTITTITAVGPQLTIGPIKYQTALTSDTITVQALLNSTPSVGSVTATACTITAIRAY